VSFQLAADWAPLTGLVSSLVQAHISCSAGAVRINRVVMSCMRSAVGSAMIAVSVSKSPVAGVERAPQALVSLHKTFTVCANMVPAQQGFTQKTSSWTKDVHPVEPFPLKGFVSHLLMLSTCVGSPPQLHSCNGQIWADTPAYADTAVLRQNGLLSGHAVSC
jgi:hypothetical protein